MAKKVTQASKGLGTNSIGLATELSLVSKLLQKVTPNIFLRNSVTCHPSSREERVSSNMVSGDNKTPLPRKEFPSPLRDDKSGGDGGSENDNLRNQNPGYFRRFMNLLVPSNLFSYKNSKSIDLRSEDNLRTIFLAAHVADI